MCILEEWRAVSALLQLAVVRAVDDMDRVITVMEGDAVTLHCPLYRRSLPVDITWHYANYQPVTVDETKAISDNGTLQRCWCTSEK